ncbi:hypothetical protein [Caballeronia sp. EK]|uniref:hypothetical protein n=1 Tax=Caballeronia sp. EK TaxID=2767469 RepID=UPI0035C91420
MRWQAAQLPARLQDRHAERGQRNCTRLSALAEYVQRPAFNIIDAVDLELRQLRVVGPHQFDQLYASAAVQHPDQAAPRNRQRISSIRIA